MTLAIAINVLLGLTIGITLITAMFKFDKFLSPFMKLFMGGFASLMLLSTPALWMNTPFDPWAFNVSRFFITCILLEAFRLIAKYGKNRAPRHHQFAV